MEPWLERRSSLATPCPGIVRTRRPPAPGPLERRWPSGCGPPTWPATGVCRCCRRSTACCPASGCGGAPPPPSTPGPGWRGRRRWRWPWPPVRRGRARGWRPWGWGRWGWWPRPSWGWRSSAWWWSPTPGASGRDGRRWWPPWSTGSTSCWCAGRRPAAGAADARRLVARVRERGAVLVAVGGDLPGERSPLRLTVTSSSVGGAGRGVGAPAGPAGDRRGRRPGRGVPRPPGRAVAAPARRQRWRLVEPVAEPIPLGSRRAVPVRRARGGGRVRGGVRAPSADRPGRARSVAGRPVAGGRSAGTWRRRPPPEGA